MRMICAGTGEYSRRQNEEMQNVTKWSLKVSNVKIAFKLRLKEVSH